MNHISSASQFQNLLSSNTYVVVDFYANWCGPCKMIAPVFEQFATQYAVPGGVAFAKVNVDIQTDIARTYGISAMPTFLVIKNGEVQGSIRGANPQALRNSILKAVADVEKEAEQKNAKQKSVEQNNTEQKDVEQDQKAEAEEKTVSGGYAISSRPDWRTIL